MRKSRRFAVLLLAAGALAGCGGGGGDGGGGSAPDTGAGGFDRSNCYYQYPKAAWPQFSGNDPLISQQWHLLNTGQNGGTPGDDLRALATWPQSKGEGVRVAVVDDAVETIHQDLAPNLAADGTWDYRSGAAPGGAPLPCAKSDDHGTSVAGIIAARDGNAFGGAGVAPRVQLAAYNALASGTNADIADALNRQLDRNAIYHNSWGSIDNGMLDRADSSFVAAIRRGVENGRGGLGAIYVFPAGNGGCFALDQKRQCVSENSNYDGYVNQFGTITACAIDHNDRAPQYAEPGANLLVCGPTNGITTTGVENSYIDNFAGTSASAPMVSGVAALMLKTRPDLSWRDVRLILAHSARHNDPGNAGWVDGPFGLPFNPHYGFGAADAQAAVALAASWTTVGDSRSLKSCGPYAHGGGAPGFPITIADAPSTGTPKVQADTIQVSGCDITKIEFVEIRFSATHPYSGDLKIELGSPSGLLSRLADARLCDPNNDGIADNCGNYDDWPFGSVRHLDEPASGNWTLSVSDELGDSAGSGRWTGWSLRFWGR